MFQTRRARKSLHKPGDGRWGSGSELQRGRLRGGLRRRIALAQAQRGCGDLELGAQLAHELLYARVLRVGEREARNQRLYRRDAPLGARREGGRRRPLLAPPHLHTSQETLLQLLTCVWRTCGGLVWPERPVLLFQSRMAIAAHVRGLSEAEHVELP